MKHDLILYGAGVKLKYVYFELKFCYNIVCIVDKDMNKQGKEFEMPDGARLFILSLDEALERFTYAKIWITPEVPVKYEIIAELLKSHSIDSDQILNYVNVSFRKSCSFVENEILFIEDKFQVCCINKDSPSMVYNPNKSDEELLEDFEKFKDEIINSISTGNKHPICKNCQHVKETYYSRDKRITQVSLGSIPGTICQFNCRYCYSIKKFNIYSGRDNIKRLLTFITFLKNKNYFDKETKMILLNGEISLSPFKKDIFETVEGYKLVIATNGEFYSEEIEAALRTGKSTVNISIDAGTADTFRVVKGRDCFYDVVENIHKYSKLAQYGQLQLKYIILPGINDNHDDAKGFVRLAYDVQAEIVVSRNAIDVKSFDENIDSCLETVETIITEARKNKLIVFNQLNDFSPPSKYREQIGRMFETL